MHEIKEEDNETLNKNTNSHNSEAFKNYSNQGHDNRRVYNHHPDNEAIAMPNTETLNRRVVQTTVSGSRPKIKAKKGLNQEDLITEINELKVSNRRDLDEIKRLKTEQQKVEKYITLNNLIAYITNIKSKKTMCSLPKESLLKMMMLGYSTKLT
jgi:hypothetical protein